MTDTQTSVDCWRMVLPASPESPSRARHEILERRPWCPRRNDLALLVTEIVTNAVRHGGGADGADVVLEVHDEDDQVAVRVIDGGFSTPRMRRPGATGGFGLHLVDALAEDWGARSGELWFRLRTDRMH